MESCFAAGAALPSVGAGAIPRIMEALEQLETQVLALLEQKAQLLAETRRLHSELEATIAAKMSLEEENRELRENLSKEEQVRGDAINRMDALLRLIQEHESAE